MKNTKKKELDIYEEYEKVAILCSDYGYKCVLNFDRIKIVTQYEAWYFIPAENGIITLFHGNTIGQIPNGYHRQFSRKMNYAELLTYIKQHGDAKYKGIRDFTFTKTGARKTVAS